MRKRLIAIVFYFAAISLAFGIDIDVNMSLDGVAIGDTIEDALLVFGTPSEVLDLQDNKNVNGIIYDYKDRCLIVRDGLVGEVALIYPYRPSEEIRIKKEIESIFGTLELKLDEEYYFMYLKKVGSIAVRFRRDNDMLIVAIEDDSE
jgi:hypothetical protein